MNSLKYDFKDASITRMILRLPIPGYGAALTEENTFFTMGQMSKKLYQFSLPEEPPKKVNKPSPPLHPYPTPLKNA